MDPAAMGGNPFRMGGNLPTMGGNLQRKKKGPLPIMGRNPFGMGRNPFINPRTRNHKGPDCSTIDNTLHPSGAAQNNQEFSTSLSSLSCVHNKSH